MEKFYEPDRQSWCGKDFQNTCIFFFFKQSLYDGEAENEFRGRKLSCQV